MAAPYDCCSIHAIIQSTFWCLAPCPHLKLWYASDSSLPLCPISILLTLLPTILAMFLPLLLTRLVTLALCKATDGYRRPSPQNCIWRFPREISEKRHHMANSSLKKSQGRHALSAERSRMWPRSTEAG